MSCRLNRRIPERREINMNGRMGILTQVSSLSLHHFVCLLVLACVFWLMSSSLEGAEAPKFTRKPRGVVVETDRYRVEISSGVMVSFFNKLTDEEYIDGSAAPDELLPHLPSGESPS